MQSESKGAAEWLENELRLWEPYEHARFRDGGAADSARQTLLMLRDAKAELESLRAKYDEATGLPCSNKKCECHTWSYGWGAIEYRWREGKYR